MDHTKLIGKEITWGGSTMNWSGFHFIGQPNCLDICRTYTNDALVSYDYSDQLEKEIAAFTGFDIQSVKRLLQALVNKPVNQ